MNLIRIRGPENVIGNLEDVFGLHVIDYSGIALPSGEMQLSGYATDDAITDLQSRGATVEVLYDNAALAAQEDELFTLINAQPPVA